MVQGSYERTRPLALWAACDSRSCYNASARERPLRTSIWVSSSSESPPHCTAGPVLCPSTALLTSCQKDELPLPKAQKLGSLQGLRRSKTQSSAPRQHHGVPVCCAHLGRCGGQSGPVWCMTNTCHGACAKCHTLLQESKHPKNSHCSELTL